MNGPMNGIVAYGAYLPYFRLDRKAIGEALGGSAGKGTRVVASYDEDTTSMGVEAARAALRGAPGLAPAALYFATADPAYLDKTNATAIHAALALDDSAMAFDMLGSIRSAAGALRAATDAGRPTLAVLSDIRTGLPGGGGSSLASNSSRRAFMRLTDAVIRSMRATSRRASLREYAQASSPPFALLSMASRRSATVESR